MLALVKIFFPAHNPLAEGVSPSLANYMTMSLDPNIGHLVSFMREEIPDYDQLLKGEARFKLINSKVYLHSPTDISEFRVE
jgi:hypothetical protein